MRAQALFLAAALAAGPATAQSPDLAGIMFDAIRDNGCAMTEAEAQATLPAAGVPMAVAETISEFWVDIGHASFDGDTLRLSSKVCSGAASPAASSGAEELVAMIRANGCRMSEDEGKAAGIDTDAARDVILELMAEGRARFQGDDAVLSPDECHVRDMDMEDIGGRQAVFVAVIEAEGCKMDQDLAESVLPGKGFQRMEVPIFVQALMGQGQAQLDGDTLVLTTPGCQ